MPIATAMGIHDSTVGGTTMDRFDAALLAFISTGLTVVTAIIFGVLFKVI